MASTNIDDELREQSKLLLRKLKDRQGKLQNIVNSSNTTIYNEQSSITKAKQVEHGRKPMPNGLSKVRRLHNTSLDVSVGKPARDSKKKSSKLSKEGKQRLNYEHHDNKENLEETHRKKDHLNKVLDVQNGHVRNEIPDYYLPEAVSETELKVAAEVNAESTEGNTDGTEQSYVKATMTPSEVRNRRIIDKNVRVGKTGPANFNESEILRECEEQFSRLNYSYSHVDDADLEYLQSKYGTRSTEDDLDDIPVRDTAEPAAPNYADKLENPGNSRQFAKFIRDTNKPKSILLSTSQRQNKSSSKVSFRSPTNKTSSNLTYQMSDSAQQAQKMLGYDWIAALIDNDSNAVNQSETFFDNLREFRKNNLEECVNDLYMDGPQELWEHPEREPEEVREALEETKVKPYLVNDRLFSEPIQRSLFAPYDYDERDKSQTKNEKTPTYEEPRFVRVSIPRSTLMSPHRVKPHRRRSFDNTDTMALSEHCLKGWNTSQPSMMPASSNIGLRDASLGIKSTMKTTLDEAEKLAANYPYQWDPREQKISRPAPKLTHRPEATYMNSMGAWPHSFRTNPSSFTASSESYKQASDDLLNSTYSLMYEMQKLKTERSDDPLRV